MEDSQLQINDRVIRLNGKNLQGTVAELRQELKKPTQKEESLDLMVKVLWDNGVESYLSPEALKKI